MLERIIGVFKLDAATFKAIEHDESATGQAAIIVAIVAIVSAIGNSALAAFSGGSIIGGAISAILSAFIGWVLWSVVVYLVGTSVFGGQATMGEMLRVIGFAYAPQVLAIIPCIGTIIGLIWTIAAGYVAVKEGLDLDTGKAIATILIGFAVVFVIYCVIGSVLGGGAAMLGSMTSG